jgi:hypothetical protein
VGLEGPWGAKRRHVIKAYHKRLLGAGLGRMGPYKAVGGQGRPLRAAWGCWGLMGTTGSRVGPQKPSFSK